MVSILLPYCVELNKDLLLEILKNVVWRSRMDDHYVDALKYGMTAKTLCVKLNDLIVDWKELTSNSQQLRQYRLLGYWAMHNFPALGKKLFGDTCKAVQRQSIEVLRSETMSSDAVDTVIMRKMKLRSIELDVCQSTLSKLRHFVETPNIVKCNEIRISRKMKSFNIEEDQMEKCWKALKYGNLPMNEVKYISNELVFRLYTNKVRPKKLIFTAAKRFRSKDGRIRTEDAARATSIRSGN